MKMSQVRKDIKDVQMQAEAKKTWMIPTERMITSNRRRRKRQGSKASTYLADIPRICHELRKNGYL